MFRPATTPAIVVAGAFGLVLVLVATVVAAFTLQHPATDAAVSGTPQPLGHVHGLGVDPQDGDLYLASHFGVFRVVDGEPERVADRWQDTMGFAVVGSGHFLASGNPDLREDLPTHLGLIESTDSAETWAALSMQGEADFHALEVAGDRIYGYDSAGGQLLMTEDRHQATWRPTTPVSGERPSRPWRGHSTLMFVELLAVHPPVVPNPARRA